MVSNQCPSLIAGYAIFPLTFHRSFDSYDPVGYRFCGFFACIHPKQISMIPAPIHTIITGFRDLMLIPPEEETIEDIKGTVEPIIGIYGHKNLYYDIVRTGRKLWVSVYITFDKDIVSLSKFKFLQDECILALAKKYPDFYFELLPDIEFTGLERV